MAAPGEWSNSCANPRTQAGKRGKHRFRGVWSLQRHNRSRGDAGSQQVRGNPIHRRVGLRECQAARRPQSKTIFIGRVGQRQRVGFDSRPVTQQAAQAKAADGSGRTRM